MYCVLLCIYTCTVCERVSQNCENQNQNIELSPVRTSDMEFWIIDPLVGFIPPNGLVDINIRYKSVRIDFTDHQVAVDVINEVNREELNKKPKKSATTNNLF